LAASCSSSLVPSGGDGASVGQDLVATAFSGVPGKGKRARISSRTARWGRKRGRAGVGVDEEGAATFFSGRRPREQGFAELQP
jgi:hypothetical protein